MLRIAATAILAASLLPAGTAVLVAGDIAAPGDVGISLDETNPDRGLVVFESAGIASKSGLKGGDLISKVEGESVTSWDAMLGVCQQKPLLTQLKLDVERDGKPAKVTLKISPLKAPMSMGRNGKSGNRSLRAGGKDRTYIVKAPPAATKGAPVPLVVLLHGDGGTGQGMIDWTPAACRDAVVLALDGLSQSWRDDSDLDFVMAALAAARAEFNIDLRRVYALGFSSGAVLSYRLGLEKSHVFAAVGIYAGGPTHVGTPSRHAGSFVFLHGQLDPTLKADAARKASEDLKSKGHAAEFIEIQGLDHDYKQEHSKTLWERVSKVQLK